MFISLKNFGPLTLKTLLLITFVMDHRKLVTTLATLNETLVTNIVLLGDPKDQLLRDFLLLLDNFDSSRSRAT